MTGAAAGQLLVVLASPVLSRLYEPSAFGTFATVTAMVITFGAVGALRFEAAIPLPRLERDAFALVALGLISAGASAVVGLLFAVLFRFNVASAFGDGRLASWVLLVPIAGALSSAYLLLNQLAVRQRRFRSIARRSASQSLATVGTQVGLGAASLGAGGLIFGLVIGQATGGASLCVGAGLRSEEARLGRQRSSLRSVLVRYRRVPLILAPAGLLNALGAQLPVLTIALWYDSEVVGWLGLTQRALALPVALIGTAVAQVYLAEVAEAVRLDPRRALRLFRRSTKVLLVVAAAILAVLLIFGPALFSLVFGPEWRESGRYAQALSVGLAGQMIGSPLSQTLVVLERQGLQFGWDATRVCCLLATVPVVRLVNDSPLAAVWALGAVSAALYGLSWILSFGALRRLVRQSS